ncbi:MAG: DUF3500 domain-containing protein [candidate division Zixibacteria bacterium]|nr:DUF3500 domain-containing protein [candidate division Zixibacteria bacterium]
MSAYDTDLLTTDAIRRLAERMGEAAAIFLSALSPGQHTKATFDFADQDTRTFWDYVPMMDRKGLSIGEMDYPQRRLAFKLVSTGLSRSGFITASTIIGIETALDMIEGWTRPHEGRDTGNYFLSLFGAPSDTGLWGWKFEGHHISLNYTIAQGMIVAPTPTFFGSNPGEAALSAVAALRPLAGVEDVARELIRSLDEGQRAVALLWPDAPSDIVTANQPFVVETTVPAERVSRTPMSYEVIRYTTTPKGLSAASMTAGQKEILRSLVREYIHRMPDAVAELESERLSRMGIESIHLAWAGGLEKRQPHYYRIQSPRFLVEYDNTQNDANHIHSVWRDPANDFGADLIAQHYRAARPGHGH